MLYNILQQGETDCFCILTGGGLHEQVLRQCRDGPLGGHFGRAKTGSLVRHLAFWVGQDVDVAEYVRSCQTCQRPRRSTAARAASSTRCRYRRGAAG